MVMAWHRGTAVTGKKKFKAFYHIGESTLIFYLDPHFKPRRPSSFCNTRTLIAQVPHPTLPAKNHTSKLTEISTRPYLMVKPTSSLAPPSPSLPSLLFNKSYLSKESLRKKYPKPDIS